MRLWPRRRTFDAPTPAARFGVNIPPEMLEAMLPASLERKVARREALSVPAVLRGRNLVCSTLAGLPLQIIGPKRERVDGYLLGGNIDPDVPNIAMIAFTLEDLIFEGISWWRVTNFGWHNFPVNARHVPIESVHVSGTPMLPSQSQLLPDHPNVTSGQVFIDGIPVPDSEIIRFDSPNPALLVYAARAIRTCLLLDQQAATNVREPLGLGYFTPAEGAEALSTEPSSANDGTERSEVDALLDEWEESRRRRAWGYAAGLKAEVLQWDPKKLQLAESRQHAVLEISRAMGIDPEDLGVSTTSRTYANREQRNQHLLDFTLSAYVAALEQRLSMRDVLPRGYRAKVDFSGFLRTDTPTRMQTYKTGLEVGAFGDKDEVREAEDKPPLTAAQKRQPTPQPPAPPEPQQQEEDMQSDTASARFGDEAEHTVVTFDTPEVAEAFRVNPERRTISGLAVPWNRVARSGFAKWEFEPDSLHWASEARTKLNLHHDNSEIVGRAVRLQSTTRGLDTSFRLGRGPQADRALEDAEDGLLDGFSIEVDFDEEAGDGWRENSDGVRVVYSGTLRNVALTGTPAFDDARVSRVAATRERKGTMPENKADTTAGEPGTVDFDKAMGGLADKIAASHKDLTEQLGESIGESITAGVRAALENISAPQDGPEPVRAARFTVTREAPVYSFSGMGHSLVKDAWYAAREHDDEAIERLRKYRKQTEEVAKLTSQMITRAQFTPQSTAILPEVIPPGYRPDLYVPQLGRDRPLVSACSQGTIGNATPFTVPTFTSSTGVTADHVEGTNPSDGSLDFGTKTVTPGAISGRLTLTREIVDSSNPAIDQIALATMRESYNQQTEAKVYTLLNGTNGVGGTITSGFVPSGAQAATVGIGATNNTPEKLVYALRTALAKYPFARFGAPTAALMGQEATTALADAKDTTGRPLLPSVGAQNASGLGNAVTQGWFVDGLAHQPAWAMTGTGDTDAGVITLNRSDVWVWESPLLTFRYEEKQGPANIEMNVFGYFGTHVLRPVGLSGMRITQT